MNSKTTVGNIFSLWKKKAAIRSAKKEQRFLLRQAKVFNAYLKRLRALAAFPTPPPIPKFNFKIFQKEQRALRIVAKVNAALACSDYASPLVDPVAFLKSFAGNKLYNQRENSVRRELLVRSILGEGTTPIFDVRIHLTHAVGQEEFDDVKVNFPLRKVHIRSHWTPKIRPEKVEYVTDGTRPVGDIDFAGRFTSVSGVGLYDDRYPTESRFLLGPIKAFLDMPYVPSETTGDSFDSAVPDKATIGKKRPRSRTAVERLEKAKQLRAEVSSSKQPQQALNKKKKNAATYAPHLDLDDPTIPEELPPVPENPFYSTPTTFLTSESHSVEPSTSNSKTQNKKNKNEQQIANEQTHWSQKYLIGDTLYWMKDSLTETLSNNLYFDSLSTQAADVTAKVEIPFSNDSLYFDHITPAKSDDFSSLHTSSNSIYFDEIPENDMRHSASLASSFLVSNDIYFEPSNFEKTSHSEYFESHFDNDNSSVHSNGFDNYDDAQYQDPEEIDWNDIYEPPTSSLNTYSSLDVEAFGNPSIGVVYFS